jgi:hypothetical protein
LYILLVYQYFLKKQVNEENEEDKKKQAGKLEIIKKRDTNYS